MKPSHFSSSSPDQPLEQAKAVIQGLIEVSEKILAQLALGQAGKANASEMDFERLNLDEVQALMTHRGDLLETLHAMGTQGLLTEADDALNQNILHLGVLDGEVETSLSLMRQAMQTRLQSLNQNKSMLGHYASASGANAADVQALSTHNNLV